MGARSTRKGKVGEREVVALLRDYFHAVERGYHQSHVGSRACDIEGTPFWIEAQCSAKPTPHAKMRQAEAARAKAKDPRPLVVMTRQSSRSRSGEWLATMRARDLLVLLAELQRYRTVSYERAGGGAADRG